MFPNRAFQSVIQHSFHYNNQNAFASPIYNGNHFYVQPRSVIPKNNGDPIITIHQTIPKHKICDTIGSVIDTSKNIMILMN